MKPLKSILDFFLYSNLFISVCASVITVETYLLVHSEINWLYAGFIFSSSIVLYNYPSLFLSGDEQHSDRHRWIFANKKIIWLISIPALVVTSVLIFFFPLKLILWFTPITVLSFAYFLPVTNLRAVPVLKAVVVAFVWTCITYFFPLLLESISLFEIGTGGISRFFFLLSLAVAFNIRDIESDKKADVKTLPVIYGAQTTKIFCLIFLLIFSLLIIFSPYEIKVKCALMLSAAGTAALIVFASEKRPEYFYSLWMDGMLILQTIILLSVIFAGKFSLP